MLQESKDSSRPPSAHWVGRIMRHFDRLRRKIIPSRGFSIFFCVRNNVAACSKHFVGDGGTQKGIDENNTIIDAHELLGIHMPAYIDSIAKGVSTVMVSYSSWNGVKMHANRRLVTGHLKKKLGFKVGGMYVVFSVTPYLFPFYSPCLEYAIRGL